jgi:hypothetical protein
MCHGRTLFLGLIGALVLLAPPALSMKRREVCIFGSNIPIAGALHGKVYDLAEGVFHLPVFTSMKPIGDVYATALNVPTQDFQEYFPGVRSRVEWFGIDYEGYFWIREPGKYRFSLASDDGSALLIDDRMIINNDGLHSTQEEVGQTVLSAGSHHMHVEYFQGIRTEVALVLQIAPPDEQFRLFDIRDYKRPLEVDYNEVTPGGSYLHTVKPAERAAFDALDASPLPTDFEFGVRALRFPAEDGASLYAIAVEVPKGNLTAKSMPVTNRQGVHAHLVALVRDAQGNVVDRVSRELTADLSDPQPVLKYEYAVRLGPGFYTVETAVVDWLGNRSCARVAYIYNDPRDGLALSDVMLIRQIEDRQGSSDTGDPFEAQGKRVIPMLASVLSKGSSPYVYFVVSPDKANKAAPRVRVQLALDGEVIATQAAALPAPDAAGRIPMVIGTASKPGHYEVQIGVTQGIATVTRQVSYSIQ